MIVLTAFYTANLTAFLTLSQFTLPIKGMQDLVNKDVQWFIMENSFIEHTIRYVSSH